MQSVDSKSLLTKATTVAAGSGISSHRGVKTYQGSGKTTSGAGSATIVVEGSSNNVNWDTIGTITLTLSATESDDSNSDSFASDDRYPIVRGNVTAISGTGASVSLLMGF